MNKLTVFYDSWCPICSNVKKNINRLDWLGLIEFQSIRNRTLQFDVEFEKLEKEMHCLNPKNGKITVGIDAIASIAARIPLLIWLWVPIKVSSKIGLGKVLYTRIASTRKIIPVNNCREDSCSIE